MARKADTGTPRKDVVAFRLDPDEREDLEAKRARRGLSVSNYYRTLQREDTDD